MVLKYNITKINDKLEQNKIITTITSPIIKTSQLKKDIKDILSQLQFLEDNNFINGPGLMPIIEKFNEDGIPQYEPNKFIKATFLKNKIDLFKLLKTLETFISENKGIIFNKLMNIAINKGLIDILTMFACEDKNNKLSKCYNI
jgi:hypothetical protein